MRDIVASVIGYAAVVFGIMVMLPQVIKSFRTKKTRDLSVAMLVLFIITCSLWSVYGLLIRQAPIVVANVITLALVVAQLILKLKYDRS